jgi:hypothetical protein
MCLRLRSIPANKQTRLICKGMKQLSNWSSGDSTYENFYTPYRGTKVPKNGFMIASDNKLKNLYYDRDINGGFIHSYEIDQPRPLPTYYEYYASYSFNVVGFNYNAKLTPFESQAHRYEMISSAIFVNCYKTEETNETEKKILSLMNGNVAKRSVTVEKLIKMFPELKRIKDKFNIDYYV